ncbi:MAG: hypothetical protein DRP00_01555 [Candidatus Aenigmatarchaeota archaeon]|nr:MAG: hypothetical protein DRP00_01555 [Candidatus Aenigmarchaeota archaeon]
MQARNLVFAGLIALGLLVLSINFALAPRAWRSFEIILPEEVSVYPGEEVEVKGGILNTGMWWLHWFNLSLSGLPADFEYKIEPSYWEHLRILREWNPEKGVYRVPENFSIKIKVPENATGLYLVNVTGQEFMSWKKVSNSSFFILRILPLTNFTITNISIPEEVTEFEPFNISMRVNNLGPTFGRINISVELPADWNISEKFVSLALNASQSKELVFTITPTNTSGEIKIRAEYPYKKEIIKIEKVGPYLIPSPAAPGIIEFPEVKIPTGFQAFVESVKALPNYVKGIIIVLIVIIVYNILSIVQARRKRKKPEEMKKKKGEAEV